MSSSPEKTAFEFKNKENVYVSKEEENESDQKLMNEYYGIYGKANTESNGHPEGKPLKQLSENDISKQIDSEMNIDKEGDDL